MNCRCSKDELRGIADMKRLDMITASGSGRRLSEKPLSVDIRGQSLPSTGENINRARDAKLVM